MLTFFYYFISKLYLFITLIMLFIFLQQNAERYL
ncbi:putative membrane protein [Enterococcus faecalis D32]|nr:putative membrane protein [Enterococcus faecalis D32]